MLCGLLWPAAKANLFSEYLNGKSEFLLGFTHPLSPDTGKHLRWDWEKKNMREVWEQLCFKPLFWIHSVWLRHGWGGGQEDALLRAKWRRKQILKVSVIIMCWHTVYNWNRRPKSKFCANAFLNIYWNLLNTLINSTLLKCMQFTIHAYWY